MSEIPFKKIESNRGKPIIVVEDQKFRQAFFFFQYGVELMVECLINSSSIKQEALLR